MKPKVGSRLREKITAWETLSSPSCRFDFFKVWILHDNPGIVLSVLKVHFQTTDACLTNSSSIFSCISTWQLNNQLRAIYPWFRHLKTKFTLMKAVPAYRHLPHVSLCTLIFSDILSYFKQEMFILVIFTRRFFHSWTIFCHFASCSGQLTRVNLKFCINYVCWRI